jgi:hypothetical protein
MSDSPPIIDDSDIVCSVCRNGDCEESNEIVLCSGKLCSGIAVHQACYGILIIPDDDYFCKACEWYQNQSNKSKPNNNKKLPFPQCILCPVQGGALSLCSDQINWVHTQCALW